MINVKDVRITRAFHSPLAVVGLAFFFAAAWTLAYEGAGGGSPAAAEPPPDAPLRAAHGTEPAATAALMPNALPLRQGPHLLRPPPEDALGYDISIEDRDGRSMAPLHAALQRAARGEGQARLVFYGASHVASDLFTGFVRRELQRRFGDAGHGIVLPAHPWRTYRHRGVQVESSRRLWDSSKVRAGSSQADFFGVHGVFVESSRRGAFGRIRTAQSGPVGTAASLFDLYYLSRPEGGSFDVFVDGRPAQRVTTSAPAYGPGYATFRMPDGPHQLEVRLRGDGPVRFFGVAVEREAPGVIVDTLGINGARARYHLLWEDALYREHLRRRNPDLVVLAYGTNESGDEAPIERYEQELENVLGRVREVTPRAACLLIGPSDRPVRRDDGGWEDRPRTAAIVNAQYRVAVRNGCGFYDLVSFSGGPLSMVEWAAADPPFAAPDHVHYTRRGYQRLGESLLAALLEGYR